MPMSASCRDGASRALGAGRSNKIRAETWQERSAGGELPEGSHCSPQTQYSTDSKHIFLRQSWIIYGNVKHQKMSNKLGWNSSAGQAMILCSSAGVSKEEVSVPKSPRWPSPQ